MAVNDLDAGEYINDAYEYPKMLLNVDWNAKIVIESDLCANVCFLH